MARCFFLSQRQLQHFKNSYSLSPFHPPFFFSPREWFLISDDEQLLLKKRLPRERQFQASVAKINEDDKKKAQRQKRTESRLVRRVLKAAKRDLHYDVLGLRNRWNYPIFGTHVLKRITPKDIKRAFYKMAKLIHPDKNLDDRAEEAFVNDANVLQFHRSSR